jgi:hypothetical protein
MNRSQRSAEERHHEREALTAVDGGDSVQGVARNLEQQTRVVDGAQDSVNIRRFPAVEQHKSASVLIEPSAVQLDEQPLGLLTGDVIVMYSDALTFGQSMRRDVYALAESNAEQPLNVRTQ